MQMSQTEKRKFIIRDCPGSINLPHVDCVMNHPMSPQGLLLLLLLLLSSASKWDNKKCAWKSGWQGTHKGRGKGQKKNSYLKLDVSSLVSSIYYI